MSEDPPQAPEQPEDITPSGAAELVMSVRHSANPALTESEKQYLRAVQEYLEALSNGDYPPWTMKFDSALIASIKNGAKTATIRYDGYDQLEPGNRVLATDEEGRPFAELEITNVAVTVAGEAHQHLQKNNAGYSTTDPDGIIDNLNEHYSENIVPKTPVTIIFFKVNSLTGAESEGEK